MSLDPLYSVVSRVLLQWHSLLTTAGLDPTGGTGWTLSVVLLVVTARLLLVPVFVHQVRHQRRVREQGANPLAGIAPALLQIPVFIGLVHVLRHLARAASPAYQAAFPQQLELYGFTAARTASAGRADLAGAPLAATFRSSAQYVHDVLGGDVLAFRLVIVGLLLLAAAATVGNQLLARRAAGTDPAAVDETVRRVQRGVLVIVPVVTLGAELLLDFPLGVVLYLLVTSLWTLGQQGVATLLAGRRARPLLRQTSRT